MTLLTVEAKALSIYLTSPTSWKDVYVNVRMRRIYGESTVGERNVFLI